MEIKIVSIFWLTIFQLIELISDSFSRLFSFLSNVFKWWFRSIAVATTSCFGFFWTDYGWESLVALARSALLKNNFLSRLLQVLSVSKPVNNLVVFEVFRFIWNTIGIHFIFLQRFRFTVHSAITASILCNKSFPTLFTSKAFQNQLSKL